MSLADYLAKNYLTADSKPDKKSKKRKRKEASSGLIIADDDSLGWEHQSKKDDDDSPITGNIFPSHTGIQSLLTIYQFRVTVPNFAGRSRIIGRHSVVKQSRELQSQRRQILMRPLRMLL